MLQPDSSFERRPSLTPGQRKSRSKSRSTSSSTSPGNLPRPKPSSKSPNPPKKPTKIASVGVSISTNLSQMNKSIVDVKCICYDKETKTRRVKQNSTPIERPATRSTQENRLQFIEICANFIRGNITLMTEGYELVSLIISHKDLSCDVADFEKELRDRLKESVTFRMYDEFMMYRLLYGDGGTFNAVIRVSDYPYFFSEHVLLIEKPDGKTRQTISDVVDNAAAAVSQIYIAASRSTVGVRLFILIAGRATKEQIIYITNSCRFERVRLMERCEDTFEVKRVGEQEESTSYCAAMFGFKEVGEMECFEFNWI